MTDLLAQMLQAADITQSWLWPAVLVFLRVGACMALMPAFGEQVVPQRVRLILALAFTAVVLPAVADGMRDLPSILLAAGGEVLALAFACLFWPCKRRRRLLRKPHRCQSFSRGPRQTRNLPSAIC